MVKQRIGLFLPSLRWTAVGVHPGHRYCTSLDLDSTRNYNYSPPRNTSDAEPRTDSFPDAMSRGDRRSMEEEVPC